MLETPILELIETIYAAALHVELWPKALVRLADLTRSETPLLVLVRAAERQMTGFAPRTDPDATRVYGEQWIHRNPLEQATRSRRPFEIASPETVMGAREFAKTPVYNEWWRPSGLGTAALQTNLRFDGGLPTILNINRRYGADDYSSEDAAIFALAARHFARAIEIGRAFSDCEAGAQAMASMLDERGERVILADRRARIVFASRTAREMLAAGGVLRLADGVLSIVGRPGRLERLIASCRRIDHVLGGGGSVTVPRPGRRPVRLTVAPVDRALLEETTPWLGGTPAAAIVTVRDPEAACRGNLDRWRARFGLTPAEARFAMEIVGGGGQRRNGSASPIRPRGRTSRASSPRPVPRGRRNWSRCC